MSSLINPEAGQPTGTQSFEQSNRNPAITSLGESGGQIGAPALSESRVTPAGASVSPNAGLQDYDTGDSADSAEDEAEREG
jgi:hypothetical protein